MLKNIKSINIKIIIASMLLFSLSVNTLAQTTAFPSNESLSKSEGACWDQAATYHGVDPWLLYAIAYTESTHNPKLISKPNRNGTYDIGLMQVNSVHLPTLNKYGIDKSLLLNGCASTYIGAWILSEKIRKYGYTWQAIAAYNVGSLNTPGRESTGRKYAQRVYNNYNKLVAAHKNNSGQNKK